MSVAERMHSPKVSRSFRSSRFSRIAFRSSALPSSFPRNRRIVIQNNDHGPAHVHIEGGDCDAGFWLHCPPGPVELRDNYGCPSALLRDLERHLNAEVQYLCEGWEKIHGV
jgi:Domain of unknown function (DUF4160)